jgi:cytochrome b
MSARVSVKVWDAPTRLVHWALVLLMPFLWWTYEVDRMAWHKLAGLVLAALLVFRVYWGFFGAATARFAGFLRGPRHAWRYLRGTGGVVVGHNPLGGWSVAALLSLLIAEVGLGLFSGDAEGLDAGPLADFIGNDHARAAEFLHGLVFDALLALIALHLTAVLIYQLRRHDLIGPMVSGRKRLPPDIAAPAFAPSWSLISGVILAAAVFLGLWALDRF